MLSAHRLLTAVAAAVVLLTTAACASNGGLYRYPGGVRPGIRQIDDQAYRNGFEEGRVQGENDARRGRSFDYRRHGAYRNAQDGYGGYGNRNEYQRVFRQGFEAGYNDGYRRYARDSRYPQPNVYGGQSRSPVYGSPATESGFRDGFEQGQRDARDGRRFDPVRAPRYREGDHDYNGRLGSRDDYKREYRLAFQQGYDQGYRAIRR
jgi:hypothetical protein